MSIIKKYIKQRLGVWFLFLAFFGVFAASFALYCLPLKAVIYPFIICFVIAAACIAFDVRKILKMHKNLEKIRADGTAMLTELPAFGGIIENDLTLLIEQLKTENILLSNDMERRYAEMIEYYSTWVHQIKTPIASMHLTLQEQDNAFARCVKSDLSKIEQYVEMVMAFLRLDSETNDLVIKPFNTDELLRKSIKKFASEFIFRHIKLEYEPIEKTIVTDEKWFSFVIEQLLSNALKYTHEGCVGIRVEGDELCVWDTGIGISAEDLPRIFEKGYTGSNGRDSDGHASGIGLYLCKRVCSKLGIAVRAESAIGRGTVIRLKIGQYNLRVE